MNIKWERSEVNTISVDSKGLDIFMPSLESVRGRANRKKGGSLEFDADYFLDEFMRSMQSEFQNDMSKFIESLIMIAAVRELSISLCDGKLKIAFYDKVSQAFSEDESANEITETAIKRSMIYNIAKALKVDIDGYTAYSLTAIYDARSAEIQSTVNKLLCKTVLNNDGCLNECEFDKLTPPVCLHGHTICNDVISREDFAMFMSDAASMNEKARAILVYALMKKALDANRYECMKALKLEHSDEKFIAETATEFVSEFLSHEYTNKLMEKAAGSKDAKRRLNSVNHQLERLYNSATGAFLAARRSFFVEGSGSVQRRHNKTIKNVIMPILQSPDENIRNYFIDAFSRDKNDIIDAVNVFLRRASTQQIRPSLFMDDVILAYLVLSNVSPEQFDVVRECLQEKIRILSGMKEWKSAAVTFVESDVTRDLLSENAIFNKISYVPGVKNGDVTDEIASALYSIMQRIPKNNTNERRERVYRNKVLTNSFSGDDARSNRIMSLIAMDKAGTNYSAFVKGNAQRLSFYSICRVLTMSGNIADQDELNSILAMYHRQKLYPLHGGMEFYIFLFITVNNYKRYELSSFTEDDVKRLKEAIIRRIFSIRYNWWLEDEYKNEVCEALNNKYGLSLAPWDLCADVE